MAYRVIIKLSKTDNNPWFFLNPANYAIEEAMTNLAVVMQVTTWKDDLVFDDDKQCHHELDFSTKLDANRYLINLLGYTANNPQYMDVLTQAHADEHTGWKEEIVIQEI
jgi:hypothetical protein